MHQIVIQEIVKRLEIVQEDLEMLQDGSWEPDDESCEASLHNLNYAIKELSNSLNLKK
jgi:hypothetical protein|tara:strand:+ start:4614 stop:4787 length:174 start_codon:yes stop_codon:yes gene_type:complete